jgi:hypothetical protein
MNLSRVSDFNPEQASNCSAAQQQRIYRDPADPNSTIALCMEAAVIGRMPYFSLRRIAWNCFPRSERRAASS